RNPMDWIDPNTFRFHFPNLRYAYERNLCYLCFQVEREDFPHDDTRSVPFSSLLLPGPYPVPRHAELCFLSWFRDQYPSRDERYHVSWFLSWSPCPTCAGKV
ncbi:ABC3F enzyme, partial [Crocuta crocuta]